MGCKENSSNNSTLAGTHNSNRDSHLTNQGIDSFAMSKVHAKEAELLSDSVSIYRYGLLDTLREDVNCDGFLDQVYFSREKSTRHIILFDGKSRKRQTFGLDLKVNGEPGADYSWVDFWGITKDTSTWEMVIEDGEIAGSRTVSLGCPSIALRKEEVGGGIITFTKSGFAWVQQAD